MRVLVVSDSPPFAQGMGEWLRQQLDVEIVGQESHIEEATQHIEALQPDLILLEMDQEARDPGGALMRFLRNGLDTQIIGVNLQDNCISFYYKDRWVMQKVGDLLQVIREAGKATCNPCSAEEMEKASGT